MTTFSSKPGWGEAKPLLERGVTIKLNDGSQIKLSPEIASKFETIRTVIGYGGIEVGKEEDIIKIFDRPAQYVRHYFQLVEKIDGRKELPNVHFTQLFDFFLIAQLMGNETSMNNLADYIFATALANQSAPNEVKARMMEIYSSYPAEPKRFITNRLAKLNHTISLKSLRNLDMRFTISRPVVVIDNQGRTVTRGYSRITGKWLYYDQTDPRREKVINQLKGKGDVEGIQIGGGTDQGITVVTEYYDQHSKRYTLYGYTPDQLEGKRLISFDSTFRWELFPLGSRFRVVGGMRKGEIRIHDLTDGSLIFSYQRKSQERYVLDDKGQYFLVIGDFSGYVRVTLYAAGETIPDSNNRPVRRNRKLFEMIIPSPRAAVISIVIDSYRRLIYIHQDFSYYIQRPPRLGEQVVDIEGVAGYLSFIKILLIVDFSGQILHRYAYQGEINIFPSAKHLLTNESGMRLIPEKDLQYIFGREVSEGVKELPDFELWPTTSVEGLVVEDVVGRDNIWIRDATKGFKITALVKQNAGEIGNITSSPNGDIIVLSPIGDVRMESDASVMQTVLYTDHEVEIINEVLSGPAKG